MIDNYEDALIDKAERDAKLLKIGDELVNLDAADRVLDVPPAIDWSWEPKAVNAVLRAMGSHRVGRARAASACQWRIPVAATVMQARRSTAATKRALPGAATRQAPRGEEGGAGRRAYLYGLVLLPKRPTRQLATARYGQTQRKRGGRLPSRRGPAPDPESGGQEWTRPLIQSPFIAYCRNCQRGQTVLLH